MTQQPFDPDLPDFARGSAIMGFLSIWNEWRGSTLVPLRSQVQTSQIAGLMRAMMIMDVFAPERIVFRYVGSLFQDIYKVDFTGMNYLDITEPDKRALRAKRLWNAAAHPAAAVWTAPAVDNVSFVGVTVPILSDDDEAPHKLMQVLLPLSDLNEISRESWQQRREQVTVSEFYRFVDIGAGVPQNAGEA